MLNFPLLWQKKISTMSESISEFPKKCSMFSFRTIPGGMDFVICVQLLTGKYDLIGMESVI